MIKLTRAVAAFSIVLSLCAGSARAAGLIEESVKLPAAFPGLFGTNNVDLDALIIRPDDDRPHPLAVINHGTPRTAYDRLGMSPRAMRSQTQEFARRGWVAVTFLRRGYGSSGGSYAEESGKCAVASYEPSGRASATDVREVIRIMSEKPYVEASRIISVGRSAGGFATVALTAEPPPGLIAAINFAGGRGSERPDEVCNPQGLVEAFAAFGKTSRIPMLWVYSENDHFFGPALARQFHAAFTEAGGKAEFIAAAPFGEDGHGLFSAKGAPIWTAYVDDFLARQNLKLADRPISPHDDATIQYPTGLSERGRDAYLKYLDASTHKAFAMSADGHYGWRSGRETLEDAVEQAMGNCRQNTDQPCRPVTIDDKPAP